MTGRFNLLNRAQSIDADPSAAPYSRVTIYKGLDKENGDEATITVGDDSGRTLEITSDWGTQEQAERILAKIKGRRYQPFQATDTTLEPSAELGDAVSVGGIYSGIFSKITTLGGGIYSDISAPSPEEVEHELTHKTSADRKYTRLVAEMRSEFRITEKEISARVEKVHGSGSENFWWSLLYDSWEVGNQNGRLFGVYDGYAYIQGEIRATTGLIGGFKIADTYLCANDLQYGGEKDGVCVSLDGIQCGPASSGVQMTPDGNLYAENGYFRGSVRAKMIDYGGDDGYFSGGGISSGSIVGNRLSANTVSTAYTSNGINTSLDYADTFNDACNGDYLEEFYASYLYTAYLYVDGSRYKPNYIYYTGSDGTAKQAKVLMLA